MSQYFRPAIKFRYQRLALKCHDQGSYEKATGGEKYVQFAKLISINFHSGFGLPPITPLAAVVPTGASGLSPATACGAGRLDAAAARGPSRGRGGVACRVCGASGVSSAGGVRLVAARGDGVGWSGAAVATAAVRRLRAGGVAC
jgi:hypothetical protein